MVDDHELVSAGFLESYPDLRWCRPGYYMTRWPSHMYIAGRDGDAHLFIDNRPTESVRTRGDVRRIVAEEST